MPKQKLPPPISGYEFAARRRAVGLDNATFKDLMGCSISSVTKWSAGFLPVSRQALELLERVELAIEEEVQRLVDELEVLVDGDEDVSVIAWRDGWEYGEVSYEIAVTRARTYIAQSTGVSVAIMPPPGRIDPLPSQTYAVAVPRGE